MQFLVSCPHQGGLLRFDMDTGGIEWLYEGHFTGLAPCWGGQKILAAEGGDNLWTLHRDGKMMAKSPLVRGSYYHDVFVSAIKNHKEALIGVISPARSVIDLCITLDGGTRFMLHSTSPPIYPGADKVYDACHFNSVCLNGTDIFGTAFIMTDKREGWRNVVGEPTGVFFGFNDKGPFVLKEGLKHPHTVCIYANGDVSVCDSLRGDIVFFKKVRGKYEEHRRLPISLTDGGRGYVRGMAVLLDGYLVGISANRHPDDDRITEVDPRLKRAYLVHIDKDGKTLQEWKMPVFEIYDILQIGD